MLRIRICFQKRRPVLCLYFKLIQQTLGEFGNEQFPDARVSHRSHPVHTSVPVVEVTDHTDARGVRRPNSKCDSFSATYLGDVRAEFLIDLLVATFAKEMKIDLAKQWRKLCVVFFNQFGSLQLSGSVPAKAQSSKDLI